MPNHPWPDHNENNNYKMALPGKTYGHYLQTKRTQLHKQNKSVMFTRSLANRSIRNFAYADHGIHYSPQSESVYNKSHKYYMHSLSALTENVQQSDVFETTESRACAK
jgi:hypothetical protein